MREVDLSRNGLVQAGKRWEHSQSPCCKSMIKHLVRRECYCSWFQPLEGTVFDQFPAIHINGKYFTLSLRVQKAMFRHVRLTKNFNNVEMLPDGNLKLRIPTQLLMEKRRTASRFNVCSVSCFDAWCGIRVAHAGVAGDAEQGGLTAAM